MGYFKKAKQNYKKSKEMEAQAEAIVDEEERRANPIRITKSSTTDPIFYILLAIFSVIFFLAIIYAFLSGIVLILTAIPWWIYIMVGSLTLWGVFASKFTIKKNISSTFAQRNQTWLFLLIISLFFSVLIYFDSLPILSEFLNGPPLFLLFMGLYFILGGFLITWMLISLISKRSQNGHSVSRQLFFKPSFIFPYESGLINILLLFNKLIFFGVLYFGVLLVLTFILFLLLNLL